MEVIILIVAILGAAVATFGIRSSCYNKYQIKCYIAKETKENTDFMFSAPMIAEKLYLDTQDVRSILKALQDSNFIEVCRGQSSELFYKLKK